MKPILFAAAATLSLLGAAGAAAAQSSDGGMIFGYDVRATARAQVQPSYEGSDDYKFGPTGSISFYKHGAERGFSASDDGASLSLIGDERFAIGIVGKLRSGRDSKDDLRGMDKLDWAGEVGGFANLWVTDWLRTRLEVRKGFGGHEGVLVDVGADAVATEGRWTASVGPRFGWADDEYTQTYFGVTPTEAARSPLIAAAYNAKGGPRFAGVQASADYQWTPRWGLTFDAGYRRLLGDAADSPLVRGLGAEDQFRASAGVRYAFGG